MVFLGLGSNIGNREGNILAAVQALSSHPAIAVKAISSLYETEPFGVEDQADFLNAVAGIITSLSPYSLLAECLRIEHRLGRVRSKKWAPRVIDIDLLVYDDVMIQSEQLTIPHKLLAERKFVLVPLAEIAGEQIIAGGKTATQLLEQVSDRLNVRFYKELVI
ncbi:2-amino-4-hydroxy-6-hydroxymethyldihydropteridine diphosphokinase|uniref:2-amino-4-hydroxy-6-hydroxymethyldihydropteridine diphosphokinase n=1 Tax=Dendrosporobacter quercicolus TaxID=146817 RepID=A0A1G9MM79_9FIRM|nr:2-amino-4-hydroxy-6-hydroxymethyldihydropteridine diphosphokinase [Dendrosporobacter quercicolus]NSL47076.1 2-amino-4-hydroxy-6-hydroxymethyldihydropteridine diphosphokinase [Dendrosporobacter quercicolus DSM 1736]SDL75131.1 2-amino-4-hydroxy-6-hydroxymethyldihydropteridinediphosphokinase [Dendrosporobacter quercicolus]